MNNKSVAYVIINGPSKSALFDSCKYAFSRDVCENSCEFHYLTGLFKPQ